LARPGITTPDCASLHPGYGGQTKTPASLPGFCIFVVA
jgi:hypothetical protein